MSQPAGQSLSVIRQLTTRSIVGLGSARHEPLMTHTGASLFNDQEPDMTEWVLSYTHLRNTALDDLRAGEWLVAAIQISSSRNLQIWSHLENNRFTCGNLLSRQPADQ